ncbi:ABC transporter substrate-binding protein [Nocardia sp. BMG111209]|uniref:ABC transporter substrate-binding protein n=1 Tax=Nocardia sp. BMG111209 TaxID=1160137 RepID=UPI00036E14A1|nr:ABC transporter substrate-binding protein [Nocardia sp. BMG111209]
MKPARTPRRRGVRLTLLALAGVLTVAVAGCGSSTDDGQSSSGGDSVVVDHARGRTTVTGTPKRVVTLGSQWLDATVALGVTPVGYIDNVAGLAGAASPWLPALGDAKKLSSQGKLDEQVAALNPDLILVDGFLADQKTYDTMTKIAPTVPGLTAATVQSWRDEVATLGKVLHRKDSADKVIAGLDGRLSDLAAKNPGLKGKTFASTWLASPAQLMVLTDPNDGSAQVFGQLGLQIPQGLQQLPAHQGRAQLSTERLDQLNTDLLLAGYSPGQDETYRKLPGFAELPAVHKNAVVFLTVQEISAINQPTALSLPYLLDRIAPALPNAAK